MLSYEFFLDLAIILLMTKLLGLFTKRISLPQVVGAIIAGLIIGPSCLNIVKESDFISKMAEVGVVLLMFTAGLETDLKELKKTGVAAFGIACCGVVVPLIGGFLTYGAFYGLSAVGTPEFIEAVFVGVILTATSVSITVETLRELGKLKGRVGTAILGAAIIDDIIGIIVLTLVIGMKDPSVSPLKVVGSSAAFFVFVALVGFGAHMLFKHFEKKKIEQRRIPILGLVFCLLLSFAAEHFFGVADITGAFFAGIILCNIKSTNYIVSKIDITSYMLFGPIFFASIGIKTHLQDINMEILWFSIAFVIVGLLTKVIGCGLSAKLFKFKNKDCLRIGIGMMSRGEVGLIVAQKGVSAGIISSQLFTSVIILVIVSSIVTPILLKAAYKKKTPLLESTDGEEEMSSLAEQFDKRQEAEEKIH